MSRIAAIGAGHELEGFALVGVHVIVASTDPEIVAAWSGIETDVGLVILSTTAAQVLQDRLGARQDLLTAVMR